MRWYVLPQIIATKSITFWSYTMKYLKPPLKERLPVAWIINPFPELRLRNIDLEHIYYEFSHFDKIKNLKFVKFPIIFQLALPGMLW